MKKLICLGIESTAHTLGLGICDGRGILANERALYKPINEGIIPRKAADHHAEKFADLYDDNKDGTATPKKIIKLAKLADHDGVIHTSWGNLSYTANNDFIVKHGDGDFGAVKVDIFNQTYARI